MIKSNDILNVQIKTNSHTVIQQVPQHMVAAYVTLFYWKIHSLHIKSSKKPKKSRPLPTHGIKDAQIEFVPRCDKKFLLVTDVLYAAHVLHPFDEVTYHSFSAYSEDIWK